MWQRCEERGRLSQLDKRPERGVARCDGVMRGGGASRWEVAGCGVRNEET